MSNMLDMFDVSQDVRVSMMHINDDNAKIELLNKLNKLNVLTLEQKCDFNFSFGSNGTQFSQDISSGFDFIVSAYSRRRPVLEGWYFPCLLFNKSPDEYSFDVAAHENFKISNLAKMLCAYVEDTGSDDYDYVEWRHIYAPDGERIFNVSIRYDDEPDFLEQEKSNPNYNKEFEEFIIDDYPRWKILSDLYK